MTSGRGRSCGWQCGANAGAGGLGGTGCLGMSHVVAAMRCVDWAGASLVARPSAPGQRQGAHIARRVAGACGLSGSARLHILGRAGRQASAPRHRGPENDEHVSGVPGVPSVPGVPAQCKIGGRGLAPKRHSAASTDAPIEAGAAAVADAPLAPGSGVSSQLLPASLSAVFGAKLKDTSADTLEVAQVGATNTSGPTRRVGRGRNAPGVSWPRTHCLYAMRVCCQQCGCLRSIGTAPCAHG